MNNSESSAYQRGLHDAWMVANDRPTSFAFSVAAGIQQLLQASRVLQERKAVAAANYAAQPPLEAELSREDADSMSGVLTHLFASRSSAGNREAWLRVRDALDALADPRGAIIRTKPAMSA